jgi:TonB-linked SusC/RagA family outer membrane protein
MKKVLFFVFLMCCASLSAQTYKLTGTVSDETGPLPGVNISVQGSTAGALSNASGRYAVSVKKGQTVVFSYVGYKTVEVRYTGQKEVNVTMRQGAIALDEAIVVGYATQKKATLTGAVSAISGDKLQERKVASLSNALQGTMPGVTIQQTSGEPGSDGGYIRVRGLGSINSDSNPLVLVDGIEMSINQIDPNTVESISVLKDAASASIYGSRASNGVILITTKHGAKGKVVMTYSGYLTIQAPTNMPDPVPAWQYLQSELNAWDNAGITVSDAQRTQQLAMIDAQKKYKPDNWTRYDTDWKKETISNNALMHSHNVTFSGGGENFKFFSSVSTLYQDGLIKTDNYKRTNLLTNADAQVFPWMKVGLETSLRFSSTLNPGAGSPKSIINQALYMLPTLSAARELDGNWGYGKNGLNPTAMAAASGFEKDKTHEIVTGGTITLTPLAGMELIGQYSRRQVTSRSRVVVQPYTTSLQGTVMGQYPGQDYVEESWSETVRNYYRFQGSYEKTYKQHYAKVLLGFQAEDNDNSGFAGSRKNFDLGKWYLSNGDGATATATGSASSWAMMSWYGRINYNFAQKYLLELSGRYDGSSRFTKDNRWGFFPSVSAGWVISSEPFMDFAQKTLDQLKLRVSYGVLGNQNIGNYPYAAVIDVGYSYYLGDSKTLSSGVAQTTLSNSNIGWEKSKQFDIGIDASFWNGKLTFTGDYYYKKVYDMLMKFPLPYYAGMSPAWTNAGDMRNEGWEVALTYRGKYSDLEYGATLTLSDNKNKITNLNGLKSSDKSLQEGYPLNGIWGYVTDGYYKDWDDVAASPKLSNAARPGFVKYVKVNKAEGTDPMVIDSNDQVYLGDAFPHYTYGLNLFAKWRGFDATVFFQGVGKRKTYMSGVGLKPFANGANLFTHQLDSWTEDHQDAAYPILVPEANSGDNFQRSDKWVKNGAYCRLKNVVIGYTLPSSVLSKIGIRGMRFYVSGQNLLTWDHFYKGYDPEVAYGGGVGGEFYPIMQTYTFGIDVKF